MVSTLEPIGSKIRNPGEVPGFLQKKVCISLVRFRRSFERFHALLALKIPLECFEIINKRSDLFVVKRSFVLGVKCRHIGIRDTITDNRSP
jgi:hypothetical protein